MCVSRVFLIFYSETISQKLKGKHIETKYHMAAIILRGEEGWGRRDGGEGREEREGGEDGEGGSEEREREG